MPIWRAKGEAMSGNDWGLTILFVAFFVFMTALVLA